MNGAACAAAALLVAAGVSGCGTPRGTRPPPSALSSMTAATPEPFLGMRTVVVRLAALRKARDAAGLRAAYPDALAASRRLLAMPPPNDLRRESLPRFLAARAEFSDETNALGRAQSGSDDAALFAAAEALETTFWSWYDAYRGKPSEGGVCPRHENLQTCQARL